MSLERAVDLVCGRGGPAQLVVLRDGEVVLDLAVGCRPDALFWTFSAGKAYVGLVVHALVEHGVLRLDDRVSRVWPAFAAGGKAEVTVRQVLQHRSGVATGGTAVGDALAMNDWARMTRRAERAPVRWPPGSTPAYQFLLYGYVLGEVARRVTGVGLPELVRTLVLEPAGVGDTYLGLPAAETYRAVPVRATGPRGALISAGVNRRVARVAVNPSAGVSTTARSLAGLYQALLDGKVLSSGTLAAATTPSCDGVTDAFAHAPIRWSQGFQLGGPRWVPGTVGPMGGTSSPQAFGHNGSNACIGWADPVGIAYAHLTDRPGADPAYLAEVADAVLDELR